MRRERGGGGVLKIAKRSELSQRAFENFISLLHLFVCDLMRLSPAPAPATVLCPGPCVFVYCNGGGRHWATGNGGG